MINEPVPNLPLLRKVLDHIDAEPETWNQSHWGIDYGAWRAEMTANWPYSVDEKAAAAQVPVGACGTAYCIAGHAVVLAGYDMKFDHSGRAFQVVVSLEGDLRDVPAVAAEILGLVGFEADELFYTDNSRETVQKVAERIAARVGEVL